MSPVRKQRIRFTRNGLLFVMGAFGWIHEVLMRSDERTTIIIACFALMGVPLMMHADESRRDKKSEDD